MLKKALDLNRLSHEEVNSWLNGFIIKGKNQMVYLDRMILENNIKRFLRSLYFSMNHEEAYQEIRKHIELILTENAKR